MAELGEGPIIAVDVKAAFERGSGARPHEVAGGHPHHENGQRSRPASERGLTSSQRLRLRWAAGGRSRPPYLGETLTRLFLLASSNTSEAAARHADLVIAPRSPGMGLLELHQIDTAVDAGRRAAREALAQAPAALFV